MGNIKFHIRLNAVFVNNALDFVHKQHICLDKSLFCIKVPQGLGSFPEPAKSLGLVGQSILETLSPLY